MSGVPHPLGPGFGAALELVVDRTGHRRYRELTDPADPAYDARYVPIVRSMAARLAGAAPGAGAASVARDAARPPHDDCLHGTPIVKSQGRSCRDRFCDVFNRVVCVLSDCATCPHYEERGMGGPG